MDCPPPVTSLALVPTAELVKELLDRADSGVILLGQLRHGSSPVYSVDSWWGGPSETCPRPADSDMCGDCRLCEAECIRTWLAVLQTWADELSGVE